MFARVIRVVDFPLLLGPNEDVDMLVKLERNIVERPYIGHAQVSNRHSQISRDCFTPSFSICSRLMAREV